MNPSNVNLMARQTIIPYAEIQAKAKEYVQCQKYDLALTELQGATALARAIGDQEQECLFLLEIANIYYISPKCYASRPWYEQALNVYQGQKLQNTVLLSRLLINFGHLELSVGNFGKAQENYDKAIQTSRFAGVPHLQRYALEGVAGIRSVAEDWQAAIGFYHKALAVELPPEIQLDNFSLCGNLGYAYMYTGQYELASSFFIRMQESQEGDRLAQALYRTGMNYELQGQTSQAFTCYEESFNTSQTAEVLIAQARIFESAGNFLKSKQFAIRGQQLLEDKVFGSENSFNPLWDHTTEWNTLLRIRKDLAVSAASQWISKMNESVPLDFGYWNSVQRRQLLHLVQQSEKAQVA